MRGVLDGSGHLDRVMRLRECTSELQLQNELISISNYLGFGSFIYGGRFPSGPTHHVDRIITSYSAPWRHKYQVEQFAEIDPTVQHAIASIVPLIWTEEMYTSPQQQIFREEARAFGIASGVSFPVHSREGDVALVSLAMPDASPEAQALVLENITWGALIATFAHDAMRTIAKRGVAAQDRPVLTRREMEALKWVASGKTTWEISKLLSISEHGVVHHVRSVMQKFDVTSRHQAAARAVALGMI